MWEFYWFEFQDPSPSGLVANSRAGASAGFFQGGGQIFFVGVLSRFIGFRVHHNYGFMAIGYFMPRK